MDEKKKIGKLLFENVAATFGPSILTFSFVGWLIGQSFTDFLFDADLIFCTLGISVFGREGLAYYSIAQIFALSVILGTLSTIFVSDTVFKKVMLLWRYVIFIFLSLVVLCVFVIIFQWFPLEMWEAWVTMAILFVVLGTIGTTPMIIKTKLEDKRYEKLLSNYKSQNTDEQEENK